MTYHSYHGASHSWPFRPMVDVIPEGKIGEAEVQHFTISEEDCKLHNLRTAFSPGSARMQVEPGRYARLNVGGRLMMSDTPYEQFSNRWFVREATGNVLIGGLGLGMVVDALLRKGFEEPESKFDDKGEPIERITVIENSPDVIDLIWPHIRDDRLRVIEGDAFDWKPERSEKFDTIYFDIWPDITIDNLPEIARLHQKAKFWKRSKESYMNSWEAENLRWMKRSGY